MEGYWMKKKKEEKKKKRRRKKKQRKKSVWNKFEQIHIGTASANTKSTVQIRAMKTYNQHRSSVPT
jgi:hypothetical protein